MGWALLIVALALYLGIVLLDLHDPVISEPYYVTFGVTLGLIQVFALLGFRGAARLVAKLYKAPATGGPTGLC